MRELMALPIGDIRFEDVVAFCSHQTGEHARLEYKERFSAKDAGKQIAKEMAAFANTQGGTLLFGVKEAGNRKPMASPTGEELGNDPKATVQSACFHNVFPPIVPEVSDYIPNPAHPSRGFLVVRVGASEDIHTIDGGTGIYIRANDQNEPVPATLDRIEWMLQRRGKAVGLQESRRERALAQLRRALLPTNDRAVRGLVEVVMGPRLVVDPLLTPQELRNRSVEFSVESACFDYRQAPVGSDQRVVAVAQGLYALEGATWQASEYVGGLDIFGNVSLVTQLRRPFKVSPFVAGRKEVEAELPRDDGKTVGVFAGHAVERIICVVRSALKMYLASGFVGVVELFFRAPDTRGLPLVRAVERGETVLGTCPVSENVIVQGSFVSSGLSKDPRELLRGLVRDILWAWGCSHDDTPDAVLGDALECHWGNDWRTTAAKTWGSAV